MDGLAYRQFCFLPYIKIEEPLTIGPVLFWPFHKLSKEYIQDEKTLNAMNLYLSHHIENDPEHRRVLPATIVQLRKNTDWHPLSNIEAQNIKSAINALFFSTVIKNTKNFAKSADDFRHIFQNFGFNNDGITVSSGSIIQTQHAGYTVHEIDFIAPYTVSTGRPHSNHKKLLNSLGKLLSTRKYANLRNRIFNALNWVFRSYSNDESRDWGTRIVMMMMAFEHLLVDFKYRDGFADAIERLTCPTSTYIIDKHSTRTINKKGEKRKYSFRGWWAFEFYMLRNSIVHGDKINFSTLINRKKVPYYNISIFMFMECVKKLLSEISLYEYDGMDDAEYSQKLKPLI
ncbi:MAG: hypothetical protein ISR95_01045 [Candidatus Marinimicrobia bacterium]|nr:hypothetical protein [Candidatus Brocadiales bacterium]MBL7046216.1 hypothetical protein [Candidatus Neomarinimicrobiota bacterium]